MHTMGTCTWISRGATRNTVSRHTQAALPCLPLCWQIRTILSKLTPGELPRWIPWYFVLRPIPCLKCLSDRSRYLRQHEESQEIKILLGSWYDEPHRYSGQEGVR